jgi:hypothetical protein
MLVVKNFDLNLQRQFLAMLIDKYQEHAMASFTASDLLSLILDHALRESAVSVKNDTILTDCQNSKMKIVKYLTSKNP